MDIDKEQSINNARAFLNEYVRLSGLYSDADDLPSTSIRIYAKYFCKIAEATIKSIRDDRERMILTECYINREYSSSDIQSLLGVKKRQYYAIKRSALLSYAMTCKGRPSIDDSGDVTMKDVLAVN